MPGRVKSFIEVKRRKDSSESRLSVMKSIGNHLREVGEIGFARGKRTESSLGVKKKRVGFREESYTREDELFKETRQTRGDRDGAVKRRRIRRFARFKNCLLYTSPSPRDGLLSRMPSSA